MGPRYLVDFDSQRLEKAYYDYIVIGTGIAGLYTALRAKDQGRMLVITKRKLADSSTEFAQGGIAAAIGDEDSPRLHMRDTLAAGVGLCLAEAVEALVNEGPECVMELVRIGTQFDMAGDDYALTKEGAHSEPRVLHARGDATGEEIRQALSRRVAEESGIEVHEDVFLIDILVAEGRAVGVLAYDGPAQRYRVYLAKAVVLATGGAGQLYRNTTNPLVATGDGIAAAYRAGAELMDLEFVQFHPTALFHEGSPKFLISEAVRGEGARLINKEGCRFMGDYDPRAELAPRDVVARAIVDQMRRTGSPHVWLDATVIGPRVAERFPKIYRTCLNLGIDLARQPIPVAPAAHYFTGGIRTDTYGRTTLPGLYACGEAACAGVHGANRLASNSLLEGLVFGKRIAEAMVEEARGVEEEYLKGLRVSASFPRTAARLDSGDRRRIQEIMWDHVGLVREAGELQLAGTLLGRLGQKVGGHLDSVEQWETANLAILGRLVARAALARRESRGGHYRSDFPKRDDEGWLIHLLVRQDPQGEAEIVEYQAG
ncbi:MAG: L-aspartate oxidase [Bacillota bacterium]